VLTGSRGILTDPSHLSETAAGPQKGKSIRRIATKSKRKRKMVLLGGGGCKEKPSKMSKTNAPHEDRHKKGQLI